MKKLFFISAIALFTTAISSCSKCQVCTKSSSAELRICEKDYNSKTEYNIAVDAAEAFGYNCKSSI